jgi:HK97 gp10 family phage protein
MRIDRINTRAVAALAEVPAVTKQEETVADRILAEARRLAPFRTGTLRRSLTVIKARNPVTGQTEYRIGWDLSIAEYGPLVEVGTEDTPPQPHLRPAANKLRGR